MSRRAALTVGVIAALVLLALVTLGQVEWVASPAHVAFTVMLGCGSAVVSFVVLKVSSAPKIPADKAAARDELELGVRRVINCNMALMEACRDLAESCRRMPPEYRPIAEHTLRFAKLMEEATYEEGANERIFPRPLFTAGDQTPVPDPMPRSAQATPVAALPVLQTDSHHDDVVVHRSSGWVAGQLL